MKSVEEALSELSTQKSNYLSLDGKLLDRDVAARGWCNP